MTKRKDGRWQQSVTGKDGKVRWVYGHTKAEVQRKVAALQEERVRGCTFEKVADEWWEKKEPKLAYNTTKGYKAAHRRAVEWLGDERVNEITPREIANLIDDFAEDGFARKTVSTQMMVIRQIFAYGVRRGYCDTNPVRDLTLPEGLTKRTVDPPPIEEVRIVKNSPDAPFGLFFFMEMYTGLRKGELLALDWSDVDLDARIIHVNKSLYYENNHPRIKLPKTEASVGVVPILDALLPVLQARKKKSGPVFPGDGGYMHEKEWIRANKAFHEATGVKSTSHQFRHEYATMLFEADVPPQKMQVLLRHAQLSTTMDVYKKLTERKLKWIHEDVFAVDVKV